ncbi:MAG: ABC transporter permease, partial [Candidatus Aminicenantes bacterium]
MLRNYLKFAFRNLKRHKIYSFINIFGLAVGMACAILILLWIQDELSYDRFHENANDIYRVVEKWQYSSGEMDYNRVTPGPLAPVLKADYPEIILSTRIFGAFEKWQLTYDKKSYLSPGAAVDHDFFSIFTFPFVKGNPQTAFSKPHSMVITEDLAKKFFGDDDPLGETVHLEHRTFEITGIIENIPRNSHLRFDFLIPCEIFSSYMEGWTNNNCYTYVRLQKHWPHKKLSEKIAGVIQKNSPTSIETLYLQPLNQIHLYALEGGGLISYVYIFSALAFFILLIACINFMNLSTARSAKRFKEIGIKKVVGSSRLQLIKQFLSESILFSLVAFACAVVLVELLLPVINSMLGIQLKMHL